MKRFLLLSFVVLFSASFFASSVSAASAYDDVVKTTSTLSVQSADGAYLEDMSMGGTNSWAVWAYNNLSCWSSIQDAGDNGSYALVQITDQTTGEKMIQGAYTATPHNATFGGTSPNAELAVWGTSSSYFRIGITNGGAIWGDCNSHIPGAVISSESLYAGVWLYEAYISTYNIVYPEDYEGENIGNEPPSQGEVLEPLYNWGITEDENGNGILNVKYQNNLPHFLTGISYLVVERMTEDWDSLDETIASVDSNPAGWANWNVNIGEDPGWYMFRIDHNQQLDSPPWGEDDTALYDIGQVWYQFYWDGSTPLSGTTEGCVGIVCNPFKPDPGDGSGANPLTKIFNKNLIPVTGVSEIITAPLGFLASLPSATSTCSPLTLTMPYADTPVELPCLSTIYASNFGAVYTTIQLVITALTAYWVSIKIFGTIKDISSPTHDRIEVAQL